MSCGQTIVTYAGGTPTVTGTVTLFDSSVAFPSTQTPSGGSFHLLGMQWFQFSIAIGSAAGAGTGTITGSFSNDKGTTWIPFYTATTADGLAATPSVSSDEVYVGQYKDIRFQYLNAVEVPTVFVVNLALNQHKPTSKSAAADRISFLAQALTT